MYRTVIFDLGRVLVNFDFRRGFEAMSNSCPYSGPEIPQLLSRTTLVEELETGRIEPRAFFSRMRDVLRMQLEYQQFCEIWSSIFTEVLVPESLVQGLAAGYRMLLLSNTNAIHFEMIRRDYPVLRHFHHMILSHEVGFAKPDRRIYEETLKHAGCPAGECFYTDDVLEYVTAARELGIDAVQFESAVQLERELRCRGIVWDKKSRAPARTPGEEHL